jgi:BolA-like protein 1
LIGTLKTCTDGIFLYLKRGLSGNTAQDIQKVDPSFIKTAGIAQSLTPGRNNGFLNMLALMKKKALEAAEQANNNTKTTAGAVTTRSSDEQDTTTVVSSSSDNDKDSRPLYHAMITKLQVLQPIVLEVKDNSHEHAGHAGNKGKGYESHFQLSIVADAFDGLNLVKRHKLIYMLLGDVMPQIHALQILQAMTPNEQQQQAAANRT